MAEDKKIIFGIDVNTKEGLAKIQQFNAEIKVMYQKLGFSRGLQNPVMLGPFIKSIGRIRSDLIHLRFRKLQQSLGIGPPYMTASSDSLLNEMITNDYRLPRKKIPKVSASTGIGMKTGSQGGMIRQLNHINSTLHDVNRSSSRVFSNMNSGAKKVNTTVNKLKFSFENLGFAIKSMGTALVLAIGYDLIYRPITQMFDQVKEFIKSAAHISALIDNKKQSEALLSNLVSFSHRTPYEPAPLIKAAETLTGFYFSTQETVKAVKMLSKIAGGDVARLKKLTEAYGKTSGRGYLGARERDMFLRGGRVPILAEYAKQTGMSKAEAVVAMSQRQITFEKLNEALIKATTGEGKYARNLENVIKTFPGAITTFMGRLTVTGITLSNMINDSLVGGINVFSNVLRDLNGALLATTRIISIALNLFNPFLHFINSNIILSKILSFWMLRSAFARILATKVGKKYISMIQAMNIVERKKLILDKLKAFWTVTINGLEKLSRLWTMRSAAARLVSIRVGLRYVAFLKFLNITRLKSLVIFKNLFVWMHRHIFLTVLSVQWSKRHAIARLWSMRVSKAMIKVTSLLTIANLRNLFVTQRSYLWNKISSIGFISLIRSVYAYIASMKLATLATRIFTSATGLGLLITGLSLLAEWFLVAGDNFDSMASSMSDAGLGDSLSTGSFSTTSGGARIHNLTINIDTMKSADTINVSSDDMGSEIGEKAVSALYDAIAAGANIVNG